MKCNVNDGGLCSVIMSVYIKDSVENVEKAIESILNQTYNNINLLISIDGEVKSSVNELLSQYKDNPKCHIYKNDTNMGLAYRLNELIECCLLQSDCEYIARMDADDISIGHRIEKQILFLSNNENVQVLGSSIFEIDELDNIHGEKIMESDDFNLKSNIIKRCPFNHPTVIFRKEILESGFRYNEELLNTQDYHLWIDMAKANVVFSNVQEPLLMFRIDNEFYSRRGRKKAINDFKGKIKAINVLRRHSPKNYFYAVSILLLRLSPASITKLAYKYLR
ncbi:glycosyltransferase [Vibrio splendidus]|uniref:glycosyltransferase n=1 Tax=Vibrio splendidus TaxID=29497 RepID=UPI00148C5796|nr:glycosyltransferase [Vibrio splendidus]NOJ10047.1 glycosyltransferase [Vibrio splendidus]